MFDITIEQARASRPAAYIAPANFDDFYAVWKDKWARLASTFTQDAQQIEDIVSVLTLEFYERDYLAGYNPEKGAFSTYAYSFAKTRIKDIVYRGGKKDRRLRSVEEMTETMDNAADEVGQALSASDVSKLSSTIVFGDYQTTVFRQVMKIAAALNVLYPPRHSRNLGKIFILLFLQSLEGRCHFQNIADFMNITASAMSHHKKELVKWLEHPNIAPLMKELTRIRFETEFDCSNNKQFYLDTFDAIAHSGHDVQINIVEFYFSEMFHDLTHTGDSV